jgi:glycosyltransferase involved in cell wall biosynthesis
MKRTSENTCEAQAGADPAYPLVSLVITSYNRAHFIENAIKSALAQDYPNLEIIISDNCSTDNTDKLIRKYLADPRIKYSVNDSNIGMIPNFDKATRHLASGKYITYVSSDDYLVNPTFVSEAVEKIRLNPKIVIVSGIMITEYTATNDFEYAFSYLHYKDSFYKMTSVDGREVFLKYRDCVSISFGGALVDRQKLIEAKAFEGKVLYGDAQVILKLLLMGDAAFIDKETYVARTHGENATGTVSKAQTCIDNLAFIDAPYEIALAKKVFGRETLEKWKIDMYVLFLSSCMKQFYRVDKNEYRILAAYVQSHYPDVYRTIRSSPHWWFASMIYFNKWIGNFYLKTRYLQVRVKHALTEKTLKIEHP